jgi:hypothetical protein
MHHGICLRRYGYCKMQIKGNNIHQHNSKKNEAQGH